VGAIAGRRHLCDEVTDIVDQLTHDVGTEFGQRRISVTGEIDGDNPPIRRQLIHKRIPRLTSMDNAMDEYKRGTATGNVVRQSHF
jgi:hypothetical protein